MPSAAFLLERILTEGYTSGMARSAAKIAATRMVVEQDSKPIHKFVAPQRFAMPRPEKPKGHYSEILEWKEEGEQIASPQDGDYEQDKYEGGGYIERVLAPSRTMASFFNAMSSRRVADVPRAPGLVAQASEQAVSGTMLEPQQEFSPSSHWTPSPVTASGEVPTGFFVGREGLIWPLPPRECMFSPIEDLLPAIRPEPQPRTTSIIAAVLPTIASIEDAHPYHEAAVAYSSGTHKRMSSAVPESLTVSHLMAHNTTAPGLASAHLTSRGCATRMGQKITQAHLIGWDEPESPLDSLDFTALLIRGSPASSLASTSTVSTPPVTPPNEWTGLVPPRNPHAGAVGDGRPFAGGPTTAMAVLTRTQQRGSTRARIWSPLVEDDLFPCDDGNLRWPCAD
ncbi:hypothetical protein L226DRAFT_560467 [Lentinus tigrinus ALCF2SS1-7]|uniref:uncharacterized protein n=1 Tax=Lentinus tigrinus ALCF2SS1-7 TaxID=1328758 RepID=UPI001165D8AB|nr:hypothetical protein L226DRAFT_560467 [Lentinus tigrinus ALCF2SS1-7]